MGLLQKKPFSALPTGILMPPPVQSVGLATAGGWLPNWECRLSDTQTPNQLPGLLVNSTNDGPLHLLDLEIVLRNALTVN